MGNRMGKTPSRALLMCRPNSDSDRPPHGLPPTRASPARWFSSLTAAFRAVTISCYPRPGGTLG